MPFFSTDRSVSMTTCKRKIGFIEFPKSRHVMCGIWSAKTPLMSGWIHCSPPRDWPLNSSKPISRQKSTNGGPTMISARSSGKFWGWRANMLEKVGKQTTALGMIRLKGQDIPTETREIEQKKLRFYIDNP